MNVPWIEKYRPKEFHEIVLNTQNKTFIQNMIDNDDYPNMLFYGPPGTGKTTTILCLISMYKKKHECTKNYIHLNASHERGIDVIRNQILQFWESKPPAARRPCLRRCIRRFPRSPARPLR